MGSERGSILPLVALVLVAGAGLCLGLARLGATLTEAAQARTAADAAALAGAADGCGAAREVAAANRARLVRCDDEGVEVEVVVRLGRVERAARAAPA